ncbi:MAG: hypothetical protein JO108_25765 [Acidobacteriaceae bacterium]|nr:hypothetical protein [Acidobacteriaceae bacterium]
MGHAAAYGQGVSDDLQRYGSNWRDVVLERPTVFSLARLSELHARASSDSWRSELIVAGEAVLAADVWHRSAPFLGGLLLEGGLV